jgi:hypothetical protein
VSGTSGTSSVDRVTASSNAGNNITFSGSGVTSSVVNAGTTTARIVYPNGSTNVTVNASTETSIQAGLLLQNGIFSTLTPIGGAATSFQEQDRFVALGAGGGSTSLPVITTGYNYAQHDGNYSCVKSGTTTAITFSAKFSASNLVITPNGVLAGLGSYTIKSKVGFINSLPYYSDNIELTSKAETYFFFNNNLTVINSPASDVPDLLFQRPTSTMNCKKIA